MIILKIIGIVLCVIIGLLTIIMLLRIKINLGFKKGESVFFTIGVLCFKFGNKKKKTKKETQPTKEEKQEDKKEKKPNKFVEKIKKKLGLDIDLKDDAQKGALSETINKIITILVLLGNRLKWLLKKFRLDKLDLYILCGGSDAADTAMDYGLVCSTVYPFVAYVTANLNKKDNAENVRIGCDFDGDSDFNIEIGVSVRIFYIVKGLLLGLIDLSQNAQALQEVNNEQQ